MLAAVDPYLEEAHLLLIEAYEQAGEAERARRSFQRYATRLRSDVGSEPAPELARRYEGAAQNGPACPARISSRSEG